MKQKNSEIEKKVLTVGLDNSVKCTMDRGGMISIIEIEFEFERASQCTVCFQSGEKSLQRLKSFLLSVLSSRQLEKSLSEFLLINEFPSSSRREQYCQML